MQFSTVLLNFWEKVLAENRVPEKWSIGADNAPKEQKNKYFVWGLIWPICVTQSTPLWSTTMLFLIVGHTHDKIDRFFSRHRVALRGHDYFTRIEMFEILRNRLPVLDLTHCHLSRIWNCKALQRFDLPPLVGMARVHAICIFRYNGIWVKWKQYLTSEEWSRPVMLVPQHEMAAVAAFRPELIPQGYTGKKKKPKLAWLNLEIMLPDVSGR